MDLAAHALASLALARGVFPRRPWPTVVGMIFAGTIAEVDLLSAAFGPAAYFSARRTYTHSAIGTVVLIAVAVLFVRYLARKQQPEAISAILLPISLAALVHLGLDLLQSEGVAVLWPFSTKRFAADSLPPIDLWILVLLLAGILVPELFRLVTSEIGAKDKRPRGQIGALVALAGMALYIGGRLLLHNSSVMMLDPHSYRGESARSVAAYPDTVSLFTWHGLVETQSQLCQLPVPVLSEKAFDPGAADCVHKPEPSAALDAAQNSSVVRKYTAVEPFPRAVVTKTPNGYEVLVRSMRDVAEHETRHRLAARVALDAGLAVSAQEIIWVDDVHIR